MNMPSPLSPVFHAHDNAVPELCQEEKHKILYFIRLVTDLNAKYSVSFKTVSGPAEGGSTGKTS
jgi:hypothetical protein